MAKETDMHERRSLLAYIHSENDPKGPSVTIDLVEVSKKGSSYHYKGSVFNRVWPFFSGKCESQTGELLEIVPLSRRYSPFWSDASAVMVQEKAKARYEQWMANQHPIREH